MDQTSQIDTGQIDTGQIDTGQIDEADKALATRRWPTVDEPLAESGARMTRRELRDRLVRLLILVTVVLTGSALGAALAPAVATEAGPLHAEVRVRLSLSPGVKVLLPPAGEVSFSTHRVPVAVEASIVTVDLARARELIDSPSALDALQSSAPDDLRAAAIQAAALTALFAALGALGLALLVYRTRWRDVVAVVASVVLLLGALTATTALTFKPDRFAQPQFSGLLSQAPYIAAQADGLLQRLQGYRAGVASIVQAVTTLYGMRGALPAAGDVGDDVTTVLHVSDLHSSPLGFDLTQRLVQNFNVDLVVDSGDITTWGSEVESANLSWIGRLDVPYVFVRGNHDSGRTAQVIAQYPNAHVLDAAGGQVTEVAGLVVAGIGDPVFTPATGGARPAVGVPSPATSTAAPGTPTGAAPPVDPQIRAGRQLAGTIDRWNLDNPDRPVDLAVIHEPYAVPPLAGKVPLVLDGHFHSRNIEWDDSGDSPTLVMREGSTGGAGISADFQAIEAGNPLPLSATLIYIARAGDRAGQVVAYDEVTVGGFGTASATVQRTVLRAGEEPSQDAGSPDQNSPDQGSPDQGSPELAGPGVPDRVAGPGVAGTGVAGRGPIAFGHVPGTPR